MIFYDLSLVKIQPLIFILPFSDLSSFHNLHTLSHYPNSTAYHAFCCSAFFHSYFFDFTSIIDK